MPSRDIHVANGAISFFFIAEILQCVCICVCLCVCVSVCVYVHMPHLYSSTIGHLCCFHVLAIINNAVMNVRVHLFKLVFSFTLGKYPGVEFYDSCIFDF